ncbi:MULTISPECIES: barstar family protein [Bacillus]|uniref:barstar family protein n=1 Tax=Bacillus TaxID=1386 RepID=UPI00107521B2|nr:MULTISPECIES: barstar family protein [Bacillus]MBS4746521.1 barnase inhibitor [Bacillus altitudinis]QQX15929.1 barstar family protein [Bacillus altitudinis]TFW47038.1 barnase inhibitor [Bacillus sp. 005/A4HT-01/001]USY52241.1 barstar family protein [Bacillus altitudinis]WHX72631.1 barstar family protein [Bacillus altitudinis]
MKKVQLNGAMCRSQEELHEQLKTVLQLPDHYGKNLDALWDCLTGEVSLPVELTWIHYQASKDELGDYAENLRQLFQEAEEELQGQFQLNIEA